VAPGAWKWPAGVVRAARCGLGLLPGVPGAEVVAAAGAVTAAARWWWSGPRPAIGWGVAG
jgi:hypothetical protein